ncbi:fumarylacetoacetate hydrolase [Colletotrichum kahawae]|uniref:Fumarylacetoacetate hydrolase n=1 Tax=Colletotrichum kahawae TaxID=34407 RepID=A0AAE0D605_COLKA|nr:fumarylacetoacetate hydrolase [Colletotrichum kahawae]
MRDPDEKPPSCDRHLTESTPLASSFADPPDLWRPRAASTNLSRPGPSNDLHRDISAPARGAMIVPRYRHLSIRHLSTRGCQRFHRSICAKNPPDQVFRLQPPFILHAPTVESPMTPRFQLAQQRTRKNKLHELRLRRLMKKDCRRVAVSGKEPASIRFDINDLTIYLISNIYALFPWSSPEIDIKGCKADTLRCFIKLKRTPTAHQVWHITKNVASDTLRPENLRKLDKYGWHADNEIARDFLFTLYYRATPNGKTGRGITSPPRRDDSSP